MKKTINISLAKQKFTIEEDAYERLTNYFEEIKKHLGEDVDGNEVIEDIEASIAEKFKNLINKDKETITFLDVESIIKVMGTEEDFNKESPKGEKNDTKSKKKKLYRETDNEVIAGVASGLGNYFDIDKNAIRFIFVILTIIPYFRGVGITIYGLMWIFVPAAKTAYQKLEMKGKEPTIDTLKDLSSKIRNGTPSFINKLSSKLENVIRALWNAFKKIVSALFVILSLLGIIFVGFITVSTLLYKNSGYMINFIPINDLIQNLPYNIMLATGFLAITIPLIIILLQAISILRKKKILSFSLVAILISVWMLGSIIFTAMGIRYLPEVVSAANNYPSMERVSQTLDTGNINLLKVSGSRIIIINTDTNATSTVVEGRKIDLNYVNISKDGNNLIIDQERYQNKYGKCLFCYTETVVVKVPVNRQFDIATSSGAEMWER